MYLDLFSLAGMIATLGAVAFVVYLVATIISIDMKPAPQKRTMRRAIGLIAGMIVGTASLWYLSCPVITVTATTSLWESELDAARDGTIWPGPGKGRAQVHPGDRLRVVWRAEGKSYYAYFVVGPRCRSGWVKYGQDGVPP